ncbi:hypothetical protein Hypma_009204 [Hypsizygus marmoreus]|uniref:Uncharacterized protein n=1 Tax=Hypsizygus marmoreus TaxID=39966 RepID=A0A369JW39_HYPMA|nr:hypothetical protein Hypma_009204 [Hypsizygus marmoreus]
MTSSTRPAFGPPRPPAPPRTVYDETSRGIRQGPLQISSMATLSNLVGYLENPSPGTDGSFLICIAGGSGVFISEALYNSIPAAQRPDLNTGDAGKIVNTLMDGSIVALGSTLLPFVLTAASGDKIRLVLYSFVVPNFRMAYGYRLQVTS